MKNYIRKIIDDLQRKKNKKQVSPVPAPGDLSNQVLSKDPHERARQLDFQAQRDQERESS